MPADKMNKIAQSGLFEYLYRTMQKSNIYPDSVLCAKVIGNYFHLLALKPYTILFTFPYTDDTTEVANAERKKRKRLICIHSGTRELGATFALEITQFIVPVKPTNGKGGPGSSL